MTNTLIEISIALTAVNGLVAAFVLGNRFVIRRAARRYEAAVGRLRPLLLDWVDGLEVTFPSMISVERGAFVDLLAKYGRALTGDGRHRVSELAENMGLDDELVRACRGRRPWRRAAAAYRLGDLGAGHSAILVSLLSDPDRRVRNAAARSLGKQGGIEGVASLVLALATGQVARAVGGQALMEIGPPAADALVGLLGSHVGEVRATAGELLGRVGGVGHARALAAQLDHPDPQVRVAVVRAVGRLGGRAAADALPAVLLDPIPYVRAAAATAIGALGRVDSVETLIAMAQNDEFLPAHAAAQAAMVLDPDAVVDAANETMSPHLLEVADLLAMV